MRADDAAADTGAGACVRRTMKATAYLFYFLLPVVPSASWKVFFYVFLSAITYIFWLSIIGTCSLHDWGKG